MTQTHQPTTATQSGTVARGYGALWRTLPRELGFHALTLPIALTGFGLTLEIGRAHV